MLTLKKRRLRKVRLRRANKYFRRWRKEEGLLKKELKGARATKSAKIMESETGLPGELLELIFERLPVLSLLRFTTVCKQWRDSIVARVAASQSGDTVTEDWLLMITDGLHLGKLSAYNPMREKWYSIGLPVDSNNRFPFAVAAHGNLVCMSDRCYRKFGTYGRVAVCDPVLKQWYELPPLKSWGVIQGMTVDPVTRAMKILAANFLDSDDGGFKLTCAELCDTFIPMQGQAPVRWKIVLPSSTFIAADCCSVFCGGRFVFLAPDYSLFAFDTGNERWIQVSTALFPAARLHLQAHKKLLVCNDSIFLFTIEVNNESPSGRDLILWGLTPEMQWVEVARAPPVVTSRFFDFVHDTDDNDLPVYTDETPNWVARCLNGYPSFRHWTASGEAHNDVFRVWTVTVGKSGIFLKNTFLPLFLQIDLTKAGDARWRWVVCPQHVPLSARPFRFSL